MLVVGAHGCDDQASCQRFQAELSGRSAATVLVVNDAELLVPASGHERGIGLVSGTGSIAVSRKADGTMLVAGGWGWLLGDEGARSDWCGRRCARCGARWIPAWSSDPLIAVMKDAFGTQDPVAFGSKYLEAGRAAAIGAHVAAVFAAAASGSALARRVVRDGGEALARLAAQLAGRGAVGGRVVAGGGVIAHQPSLADALRDGLSATLPEWQMVLLTAPPVRGALALAGSIATGHAPFGHFPTRSGQPAQAS